MHNLDFFLDHISDVNPVVSPDVTSTDKSSDKLEGDSMGEVHTPVASDIPTKEPSQENRTFPEPRIVEDKPIIKRESIPTLGKAVTTFIDWEIPTDIVLSALSHHAQQGDVITPSTVYLALPSAEFIPESSALIWIENYLHFLYRLQLHVIAAKIIKSCPLDRIKERSFRSTSIVSSCSNCQKTHTQLGWFCQNCKQSKLCAICHQIVKGHYAWCYVCGHGGHREHMANWFKYNSQCPIGCSHICRYTPTEPDSVPESPKLDRNFKIQAYDH